MKTYRTSRFHRASTAALAALLLVPVACQSSREQQVTVPELVQGGHYSEAYQLAEEQAAAAPEDEAAQAMFADMKVILVLEDGRRLLFDGMPTQALARFEEALVLDPANETVQAWIDKTKRQLADEWLDVAQELASISNFTDARTAFEKVLEYQPTNVAANEGLYRIIVREQYEHGLGRDYYTRGLDDLRNYELWASDRNMGIAAEYDPDHERAVTRRAEVRAMLADQRLAQADDLAEKGLFFAARNEYRLVQLLDDVSDRATVGLNRMDNEVRASGFYHEAELQARRGEFVEALEALEQGVKFTEHQKDAFSLLTAEVEDARLKAMYDEAVSLYKDQLYVEAVAAFDRLLEKTESFDDAISRRRTLQEFIASAETLYAEAIAATDPEVALGKLLEIEVFWSEYRDVRERIVAVEAQLAAEEGATDADTTGEDPGDANPPAQGDGDGE